MFEHCILATTILFIVGLIESLFFDMIRTLPPKRAY